MANSIFIKADELAKELDISQGLAYKMIAQWNEELRAKGYDRGRPGKQEVLSGEDLRGMGGVIGCQPTRTTGRAHGTLPSTSRTGKV